MGSIKWRKDEKENRFTKKLAKEVPEKHGMTKNSQFVQDKKEEELSQSIVYSELPLDFNISFKTLKSSLKLIQFALLSMTSVILLNAIRTC